MTAERLYFRQLLAGRDFAASSPIAAQMVNFVYLIGDQQTGECLIVDPAWAIDDLLQIAEDDGMQVTGVLATHYHPDHIGGDLMGMATVEGIKELLEQRGVKIHCQNAEVEWIKKCTGVSSSDLAVHESGDFALAGEVKVQLIHTPGHTPGSQCFLVENRLVAGDTLFLDGCGRTDLPGGDSEEIYRSLHQRLAHLADDTVLYPGHLYGPAASASLGDTRRTNQVFQVKSLEDWKRFMG